MQILLSFESQTTLADIMSRDRRSSGHIVSDALKAYWKGMQPKEELVIKRPKLFGESLFQDPPAQALHMFVDRVNGIEARVGKLEDVAHTDSQWPLEARVIGLEQTVTSLIKRIADLEASRAKIGGGLVSSFPIGGPSQPKKQVDLSPAAAWPNIEKGPILTRGGS